MNATATRPASAADLGINPTGERFVAVRAEGRYRVWDTAAASNDGPLYVAVAASRAKAEEKAAKLNEAAAAEEPVMDWAEQDAAVAADTERADAREAAEAEGDAARASLDAARDSDPEAEAVVAAIVGGRTTFTDAAMALLGGVSMGKLAAAVAPADEEAPLLSGADRVAAAVAPRAVPIPATGRAVAGPPAVVPSAEPFTAKLQAEGAEARAAKAAAVEAPAAPTKVTRLPKRVWTILSDRLGDLVADSDPAAPVLLRLADAPLLTDGGKSTPTTADERAALLQLALRIAGDDSLDKVSAASLAAFSARSLA